MATIEELKAQIESLLGQIYSLQNQLGGGMPSQLSEENESIERYLSEFTHREGVMLTIAGLFSLISFAIDQTSTKYFLIWIMPFLIFAIGTYVCSAKRINIIPSLNELPLDVIKINELLKQTYFTARFFHQCTDVLLVIFFTTFILNYYFYIFVEIPDIKTSIIITLISIITGISRLYFSSRVNKNKQSSALYGTGAGLGSENGVIAVGAPVEKD